MLPWILRPIRPGDDGAVRDIIHAVMTEHGCGGAGFAIHDAEVDAMSRSYRDAQAAYYVVTRGAEVLGGAGFARLAGTDAAQGIAELRKMYFLPAARGLGLGRALLELLIDELRLRDYRACYLETTSWMERAQQLYQKVGFVEIASAMGATGHHGCDRFFHLAL